MDQSCRGKRMNQNFIKQPTNEKKREIKIVVELAIIVAESPIRK
jgi:hypothetical protein